MTKEDLKNWVEAALLANGGAATIVQVAEHIWRNHERELRAAGTLFYTWQYDMRWAATQLREEGKMRSAEHSDKGLWELASLTRREK